MPVMIPLTTAEHGGKVAACGDHDNCGVNCDCGCPYTGMEARGLLESVEAIERRYPGEWLALVIPPGEDEFAPEQAMLVVHASDDEEVWEAVSRITHNQVVHVYFNGPLEHYMAWADSVAP